jgi:hypothetical protein
LVLFAALLVSAPRCSCVFLGALKPTGCDEAALATDGAALATDGAALDTGGGGGAALDTGGGGGAALATDGVGLDTGGGGGGALDTGGGAVACEEGVEEGSCSVQMFSEESSEEHVKHGN